MPSYSLGSVIKFSFTIAPQNQCVGEVFVVPRPFPIFLGQSYKVDSNIICTFFFLYHHRLSKDSSQDHDRRQCYTLDFSLIAKCFSGRAISAFDPCSCTYKRDGMPCLSESQARGNKRGRSWDLGHDSVCRQGTYHWQAKDYRPCVCRS